MGCKSGRERKSIKKTTTMSLKYPVLLCECQLTFKIIVIIMITEKNPFKGEIAKSLPYISQTVKTI